MKVEVFVRVGPFNNMREGFWHAVEARWLMDSHVRLIPLYTRGIAQTRRRAEFIATTDPYIFTDDDVLIVGRDWIRRGREAMLAQPEYAVCSSLSLVEGENEAKPPAGAGAIYPMHMVGAPMWIRKGVLGADLPKMTLTSECGVIDQYVKAQGFREGLITGLRHNHLGHGFSSTPGLDFGY